MPDTSAHDFVDEAPNHSAMGAAADTSPPARYCISRAFISRRASVSDDSNDEHFPAAAAAAAAPAAAAATGSGGGAAVAVPPPRREKSKRIERTEKQARKKRARPSLDDEDAAQRLRMERAQALNIQFQKDEVIRCTRCKALMRAPCEAAALRCAGCRVVINPSDCAENRNLEQGGQFQKDEVIRCTRCKALMRATCEAVTLRCAGCRAVINPSDCAENRNLEQGGRQRRRPLLDDVAQREVGDGRYRLPVDTVSRLEYGNGNVYTGGMRGGRPEGQGKMFFKTGDSYDGGWLDGVMSGDGVMYKDSGPNGTKTRERSEYIGAFRSGLRNGLGKLVFQGVGVFSGRWVGGVACEGEWYDTDGVQHEKGFYCAGKLEGEGRRVYNDGSAWEGTFRQGLRHGRGTYTNSVGCQVQEGVWKNDEVDHDHTRRALAFEHMQEAGDERCERLKCPITHGPLLDPVTCADGHTYDRCAIYEWLRRRRVSPVTNEALAKTGYVSLTVRGFVEDELDRYAVEMDAARPVGASAKRKVPAASAHPAKRMAPAASARPAKKPRGRGAM